MEEGTYRAIVFQTKFQKNGHGYWYPGSSSRVSRNSHVIAYDKQDFDFNDSE